MSNTTKRILNHAKASSEQALINVTVIATALLKLPFEEDYSKEWNDALHELLRRLP